MIQVKHQLSDVWHEPEEPANLIEELNRLRKENIRLKGEREILKKALAFFAKEQK